MESFPFSLPPLPSSSDSFPELDSPPPSSPESQSDPESESSGTNRESRDRREKTDPPPRFFGEASTIDIGIDDSSEGATQSESAAEGESGLTFALKNERASWGRNPTGIPSESDSLTIDHLSPGGFTNDSQRIERERFAILEPLAKGGLGQVFLARDQDFGRRVALKEIQERHAANPRVRARFAREAEIAGNLEHPGIVPVYAIGKHGDGRPYYVMRLIRGESFKEAIRKFHQETSGDFASPGGALSLRKLLIRFLDACHAIAYAHSRGVVHRDIKPSNIMIGEFGETSVVDWGLAKIEGRPLASDAALQDAGEGDEGGEESEEGENATLTNGPIVSSAESAQTAAGSAFGTPEYMSPEQAAGHLEAVGPSSDIFGLGATLYAILTGRPPHQGTNVSEIVYKAAEAKIIAPRSLKPGVPRELDAICRKATAKRPEDRYPTVTALAEDIERWMAGAPVAALPEGIVQQVRRKLRKHRAWVIAGGIVVMLAAVGLAIVSMVLHQTNQKLDTANTSERDAKQAAQQLFLQALQAIGSNLSGLDSDSIARRPELQGYRKEQLAKVLEFYRRLQIQLEAGPEDLGLASQELLADAYVQIGYLSAAMGSSQDSDEGFRRGIGLLDRLRRAPSAQVAPDDPLRLKMAQASYVWGLCAIHDPEIALPRFQKVHDLINEGPVQRIEHWALLAEAWRQEGQLELRRRNPQQAVRCLDEAIFTCRRRFFDSRSPSLDPIRRVLMAALHGRAKIHIGLKEFEKSRILLKESIEHSQPLLARSGSGDRETTRTAALVHLSMAETLGHLDEFEEALRHARESVKGLYGLLGDNSGSITRYTDLADAFLIESWLNELSGQTEQAEFGCEQALRMFTILSNVDANNSSYTSAAANVRFNLAELAWERGYASKARDLATDAAQASQGFASGRQQILAALAAREFEEAIQMIGRLKLSAESSRPYEAACLLGLASSEIAARDVRNRYAAATKDFADRALAILLHSDPKPKLTTARRAERDQRLNAIRDRREFQQWIQAGRE